MDVLLQQQSKQNSDAKEGDPRLSIRLLATNSQSEGIAVGGQNGTKKFNYLSCTTSPR